MLHEIPLLAQELPKSDCYHPQNRKQIATGIGHMELTETARRIGGIDTKTAFILAMRDRSARTCIEKSLQVERVKLSIEDLDEAGLARAFDEVDAIESAFLDEATFYSKVVWKSHTYDPNDPDDEDHHYPVQLRCFGGVYYIFALELDDVGFFPNTASAISYIALEHPNLAHPLPTQMVGPD